jgi:methionyl-tRNA formyltransferase
MKTVFMGTPELAATVLEHLYDSENQVELVITQPDRAKNRGKKIMMPPVKEVALAHNTEVMQPEKIRNDAETIARLREIAPDIIVVAAYGQIIPEEILNLPKFGCINVHASLLPKLRGASPIQQAIVQGEEKTGVTIMQMEKGLDTGDMILSEEVEIGSMNASELTDCLAQMGGKLVIEAMKLIEDGKAVFVPQDDEKSTYAGLVSKQDGKIDFNKSPEEVERLIRGFDPWPGAFCHYNPNSDVEPLQMKIWKAIPTDEPCNLEAGTIVCADKSGIKISCGGKILVVTEIQAPGKKRMAVSEYLKGHAMESGSRFQ